MAIHNFGFSGTNDDFIMHVGDSTGYYTSTNDYQSSYDNRDNGPDARSRTNAYGLSDDTNNGIEQNITVELVNVTGNSWTISHTGGTSDSNGAVIHGGGSVSLSNALDRLRIKTENGRTLDHGHVTVYYETEGSAGSGGSGTLTDVQVKQYSDNSTPRTEYGCSNPIEVEVSAGIATVGIGSTSNAYGKRYIGSVEPTTDVCDGDIWYDTNTSIEGVSGQILKTGTYSTGWGTGLQLC